MTPPKKILRTFHGVVVSDKMAKTIIVSVDHQRTRPPYQKSVTISRRYKVHDEQKKYRLGDQVDFEECRPLSRDKRWRVREKSDQ